jgi:D-glycero-D-manno-heptose 1,7-bisphosphate phosphatase
MNRRAVFLDRDGVLNRARVLAGRPFPPASVSELEILPLVRESLTALRVHGYLLVVVTNQPDVSRGSTSRRLVDDIHERLRQELPLDVILTCFHDDDDGCDCRKPQPGLFTRAAREYGIHLQSSFMVGDRWRDIEAGRRAGCNTFFIDCRYDEPLPVGYDHRVTSLAEASAIILAQREA